MEQMHFAHSPVNEDDTNLRRTLTTASCPTQRWRLGRTYWRVDRDEGFRKSDYTVDGIPGKMANEFVVAHHYSRSYPISVERVGLFKGTRLVGVALFSISINNSVIPYYAGVPAAQGLELGGFIMVDDVPYCGESFFLAAALKHVRRQHPELRAIVAYSDPMQRKAADGSIIMPGHIGIAYQATNAVYLGRSSPKMLHLNANGNVISTRGASKVRKQERGAPSAEKRLVDLGAPARKSGQDSEEWVAHILSGNIFHKIKHPGNHVYCWSFGTPAEKRFLLSKMSGAKRYPKSHDPLQLDVLESSS